MKLNTENGVAVQNDTAKAVTNIPAQTAADKKEAPIPIKAQANGKPEAEKAKPQPSAQAADAKPALSLDSRLKLVNDLHRRSVQRLNLITRMSQLEAFEIALLQENDELEDNPYQGCKLIIRDDQNRDFVTTTPGLIRMVAQYIFSECDKKLQEIESTIIFPNA